jgi:ATP-dependent Clp protease ATP-binding subunit ClpA
LARGELRAIGATTLDEYLKYFEKDFGSVIINTEVQVLRRGTNEKKE